MSGFARSLIVIDQVRIDGMRQRHSLVEINRGVRFLAAIGRVWWRRLCVGRQVRVLLSVQVQNRVIHLANHVRGRRGRRRRFLSYENPGEPFAKTLDLVSLEVRVAVPRAFFGVHGRGWQWGRSRL